MSEKDWRDEVTVRDLFDAMELIQQSPAVHAIYLGDNYVKLPNKDKAVWLTKKQARLLEALLDGSATTAELARAGIVSNASQLAKAINKRLGGEYIQTPGKAGKGKGYSTTIRDGRE